MGVMATVLGVKPELVMGFQSIDTGVFGGILIGGALQFFRRASLALRRLQIARIFAGGDGTAGRGVRGARYGQCGIERRRRRRHRRGRLQLQRLRRRGIRHLIALLRIELILDAILLLDLGLLSGLGLRLVLRGCLGACGKREDDRAKHQSASSREDRLTQMTSRTSTPMHPRLPLTHCSDRPPQIGNYLFSNDLYRTPVDVDK